MKETGVCLHSEAKEVKQITYWEYQEVSCKYGKERSVL